MRILHHALVAFSGKSQLGCVPALALKIFSEALILESNSVLTDLWDAEQRNSCRQNAETRCHPKRILRRRNLVISASFLDVWEYISSHKGTDLANGGRDSIVSSANASRTGFGGQEANVVSRTELAEGQEDTVHDSKGSNVLRDLGVDCGHDETDNGLEGDTDDERVARSKPVADEGTNEGSGEVEQVNNGVPTKDGGQWCLIGVDAAQDFGRIDTESVDGKLARVLVTDVVVMGRGEGNLHRTKTR